MTDRWSGLLTPDERQAVCDVIDGWAERELVAGEAVVAVDRQPGGDPVTGAPRWYLRLRGGCNAGHSNPRIAYARLYER